MKTKILAFTLSMSVLLTNFIPATAAPLPTENLITVSNAVQEDVLNAPSASADEQDLLPAPANGPYLDLEVLKSYGGINATYAESGRPNTVMSQYTDNPGEIALNGSRKGIVTFELDDNIKTLDWNCAAIDLVTSHGGQSYGSVTAKAYLVQDYELDTVTWNTYPAKVDSSPECTFNAGAGKYAAVRCDVSMLIKWAVKQDMDHVNIALEYVSGGQTWYGSERYTDAGKPDMPVGSYTPTLRLFKDESLPEDGTPPEATAGDHLDCEVLYSYSSNNSTYADSEHPDTVMSQSDTDPNLIDIIPNKAKGLISFELDEQIKNLDWDYAAIDLVKLLGGGLPEMWVKSYLVKDYNWDTVTWNSFPEKLEGSPEKEYYGGGYKNKTTRYDLTELIKWAVSQEMDRVNIAIEGITAAKTGVWHGTERYEGDLPLGSYTPTLKLLKVSEENRFKIEGGDQVMLPDEYRFLDYVNIDETAEGTAFSSADESIATVTPDGVIHSVSVGETDIILTDNATGKTQKIHVTVEEDDMEEDFRIMRQRWLDSLTITETNPIDLENQYVKAYVQDLSNSAQEIWDTMNKKGEQRDYLWTPSRTDGGEPAKQQFRKLKTLTLAFVTKGTTLYGDLDVAREIVDSLEFLTGTGGYPNGGWRYDGIYPESGNWWDWQIGAAQPFCDILMMMEKYLDNEEVMRYTGIIGNYAREADSQITVGGGWFRTDSANLTDSGISVLAQGILREDSAKIKLCIEQVPKAMKIKEGYASFGEGRYEDGSFIAHSMFAYNGGYGADALKGVAKISNVVAGTQFDFPDDVIDKWYNFSIEGYLPLLYKGKMMTMVDGRSISRHTEGGMEYDWGKRVMSDLLVLAKNSPNEAFKQTVQSVIKYNIAGALPYFDEYAKARDFEALCNIVTLMEDDSVVAMPVENGIKMYGAMCRVVQTTDKYTAGVSLTRKDHIAAFENTNGEGWTQWHFNSGNLFIYNNDLTQFAEAYYPTMDFYRLPGLTADTETLPQGKGDARFPDTTCAGGANDGEIAAIAYSYSGSYLDRDTRATKSYFLMEDGIVQIGTDIRGTTNATIETTVESRMLNEDGSNLVLINGEEFDGEKTTLHLEAGSWIHMEGSCEGADMAYYFPEAIDIEIQKELRTGDDYAIWYLKIGINHGTGTVENGEYLYVTLPGMSVDEIKAYAANNSLEVIDSSKTAHVIKYRNGNVLAINYWGTEPYKTDWLTLDAEEGSSPASSVIVTENAGLYTMSVADPNYANAKFRLTSAYPMNVVSKDDAITVVDENTIIVDTTNAGGHSRQISFTLEGKEPNIIWPAAEDIYYGQSLADSTLTGGSEGIFAWAEPETIPEGGTHEYAVGFTSEHGITATGELPVNVNAAQPDITIYAPSEVRIGDTVAVTADVANRYNSQITAAPISRMTYTLDGKETEFSSAFTIPNDEALVGKTIAIHVYTDAAENQYEAASAQWDLTVKEAEDSNPTADKDALRQVIWEADTVDPSLYTGQSISVLKKALAEAKSVLADNTLTRDQQDAVDAAAAALRKAIDCLVKKTDSDDKGNNDNNGNNSRTGNNDNTENTGNNDNNGTTGNNRTGNNGKTDSPKTADNTSVMLWLLAALAACGTAIVIVRKKLNKT